MADLTGQRLGQYLILERISKGATSTVYKAHQEKLERYVAVKVLSPHFIDEEGFLERFKQEARAVAQLDHPNILPVYDFDQVGDVVYIVMKYVETGTLKDLLGAPLDLRIALEIFTQVGLALGYAHRQGVIHRDVKPSNVLLGEGNWALLTDFGLAKIRAGERKLTRSGIGMGTPDYMSPEQAQGLPVDGRADLYSLGCMLHEMLTGRVPFEADSGMAVIVKHISEPPRPPRQINPKLPLAVEQVILRSLEKDPSRRYQTAEAMVADLARAIGRADQFVLPIELSTTAASRSGLSRRAAPAARVKPPSALSTRFKQTRVWLRERPPVVAAQAHDLGSWIMTRLGRLGRAIRAGLARFGSWLRQRPAAVAARVRPAFKRVRAARAARAEAGRATPARKPASTRSRSSIATKPRSPKSKVAPASKAQPAGGRIAKRVRLAVVSVRKRGLSRRLLVAIAVVLALLLLVALALRFSLDALAQVLWNSAAAVSPAVTTGAAIGITLSKEAGETPAGAPMREDMANTPDRQRFPVNRVSWNDADVFCRWCWFHGILQNDGLRRSRQVDAGHRPGDRSRGWAAVAAGTDSVPRQPAG